MCNSSFLFLRVIDRYKKVIEYHLDQDDYQKIRHANKDILQIKKVLVMMEYLREIDLENHQKSSVMVELLEKIK